MRCKVVRSGDGAGRPHHAVPDYLGPAHPEGKGAHGSTVGREEPAVLAFAAGALMGIPQDFHEADIFVRNLLIVIHVRGKRVQGLVEALGVGPLVVAEKEVAHASSIGLKSPHFEGQRSPVGGALCARGESNSHALAGNRSLACRVYQFRHARVQPLIR